MSGLVLWRVSSLNGDVSATIIFVAPEFALPRHHIRSPSRPPHVAFKTGAKSMPAAECLNCLCVVTCATSVTTERVVSTNVCHNKRRPRTRTCTTIWRSCAQPIIWCDIRRFVTEAVASRAVSSSLLMSRLTRWVWKLCARMLHIRAILHAILHPARTGSPSTPSKAACERLQLRFLDCRAAVAEPPGSGVVSEANLASRRVYVLRRWLSRASHFSITEEPHPGASTLAAHSTRALTGKRHRGVA